MLAKCSTAVRVSQCNARYVSGDLFGMNTASPNQWSISFFRHDI